MRHYSLRLVVIFIVVSAAALATAGQTGIELVDGRIMNPSDPGPLADQYPYFGTTGPVWTGSDWLMMWGDDRAIRGLYAQRISPDGTVRLIPNPRLGPQQPGALVPFGTDFLLGHGEGISLFDHALERQSFTIDGYNRALASLGDTALAWFSDRPWLRLIRHDSETTIHVSDITGGISPSALSLAAGDSSFLVTCREAGKEDRLLFNIVNENGQVVLDQPARLGIYEILDPVVAWDGARWVVAWESDGPEGDSLWIVSIEEDGTAGEPLEVMSLPGMMFSRPQLARTADETLLLTWWQGDPGHQITRAMTVEAGKPLEDEIVLSDSPVTVRANGAGQLALQYLLMVRLLSITPTPPLVDTSVIPLTDWIPLRYGTLAHRRLRTDPPGSVAVWRTACPFDCFRIDIGSFGPAHRRLESAASIINAWSYDIATNGSASLVVWRTEQREDSGGIRQLVLAQPLSPAGDLAGTPIELGEGMEVWATAHGDGFLVLWTTLEARLVMQKVGTDGVPEGEARPIAEPIPGQRGRPTQGNPSFVSLEPSKTLMFFQEGDFQYICRITCPTPPAPGNIRSIVVENGESVSGSLETHTSEMPRVLPKAARRGERILLTFFQQSESGTELYGTFVDDGGAPLDDPFLISDEVDYQYLDDSSAVSLRDAFVVAWRSENDSNPSWGDVRAAVIRDGDGDILIEEVKVSDEQGGAFPALKPIGPSSVLVLYDTPAAGGDYGGTWQVAAKQMIIDVPERRRRALRR